MNTRQALEASLRETPTMASLAKREAVRSLRKQLVERIGLFKFELEAEAWELAAVHGERVVELLRSLHENEEA